MAHIDTPHLISGERELALHMRDRWFPDIDLKAYLLAIDKEATHFAGRFRAYNVICRIGGKMQQEAENSKGKK